jgi:hypothetical protein
MARTSRLIGFFLPCLFLALLLPRPLPGGDDWQPIAPEDLAMKDNPASPGAHAMILYREDSINDRDSYVMEYKRIKIFTEKGKEYANVEIPFIKGESDVKDLRARTIEPDGRVVNFDGKPFEKLIVRAGDVKFLAKTFTLPEVQPGCIIEYRFRIQRNPNFYYDTSWEIQDDLFQRQAIFSIVPYEGRLGLFWRHSGLPKDTKIDMQKDHSFHLEMRNVPGFEEETYTLPEAELKTRVDFFYREQGPETSEQFWNRIGKSWDKGVEDFLDKKGALEKTVAETVGASDPPETKLRKLYTRAQAVRNMSYERSKTEKEEKRENLKENKNVEDVLKHGYGTARQINYLFTGLVRAAGFESAEVFVAPRNHRIFHPDLQDTRQLRADVVYVRSGSQDLYLDPACAYCPFGLLPWYETVAKGIRVSKDGGTQVLTSAPRSADAILQRKADLQLDAEGTLDGKLQVDFLGQRALAQREDAREDDEAGRSKRITDLVKGWLPAGADFKLTTVTGWEGSAEPLHVEGTLHMPGFALAAGRRLLLPVGVFQAGRPGLLQHAKRINAVYFSYPWQNVDDVTIQLPPGYRAETLPAPKQMPGSGASYESTSKQEGSALHIARHETIDGIYFPVEQYPVLRGFFSAMKANDEQQAILQSADSAKQN